MNVTTRVKLVVSVVSSVACFLLVFSDVSIQILNSLTYILGVRRVALNRIVLEVQVFNVTLDLASMGLVA